MQAQNNCCLVVSSVMTMMVIEKGRGILREACDMKQCNEMRDDVLGISTNIFFFREIKNF
jgi:hypothetical protein